ICCCWRSKCGAPRELNTLRYAKSAPAPAQLLGRGFVHTNPHHQSQQGRRAGSLFHRRKHT
ncbi:unnamed protein product, partial [Ectocarpus sp. 13 AM-2016]